MGICKTNHFEMRFIFKLVLKTHVASFTKILQANYKKILVYAEVNPLMP